MNFKISHILRKDKNQTIMNNSNVEDLFQKQNKRLNEEIASALLGKDSMKIRTIAKEITNIWIRQSNRN
ncbi:hypothetical protein NEF87_001727 [Candidatus Lokiarchaeum ossiferum]|uniref:Uncharacterized protein n=2 Tax=Candidatus Lokiarchaeum ossiferum TaxID=2951803 RepID=A0ABY6HST3_9ARCH|nr:hypothetical protein NEF87_001727 [Candidatus Lokiarchaeum sp. B-35]